MVLTILFASYFERYSIVGIDKMVNGDFTDGLFAWKTSRKGASLFTSSEKGVNLTAPDGSRRIYISQNVKLKHEHLLKLSGLLRTSDVIKGNRRWKSARLAAVQNRVFPYANQTDRTVISTQSGTIQWKEISRVFEVWNNAESIDVVFELLRAKGSASIRNVSLVEVSENQGFIKLRTCLKIAWVLLVLSLLWKGRRQTLIAGMIIVILTGILLTADSKHAFGAHLSYWLTGGSGGPATLFGTRYTPDQLVFAAGHLIGFWILSLMVLFHTKAIKHSIILCLYLLLFAACTEVVQLLSEDRNASFADLLIDMTGIMVGWLVWKFARHRNNIEK